MADPSIVQGNWLYRGVVQLLNVVLPNGCVENKHVKTGAAVAADKLEHRHRTMLAQDSDATATAQKRVVHVVHGTAGTLRGVKAGCVTPCSGDATITVDLHVNGSSVLTAGIELDSTQAGYETVAGTIDSSALAADDVVEVVVTVAAGTGTLGEGLFVAVEHDEDAA